MHKGIRSILKKVQIYVIALLSFFSVVAVNANADSAFLTVEEAYPVSVSTLNDELNVQWRIAEGYYLYAKKISAKVWHNGKMQTLPLEIPKGKMKYDENFDEELEIHYTALNISAELSGFSSPYYLTLRSQGCAESGLCYPPRTQYFSGNGSSFIEVTKETFETFTASENLDQAHNATENQAIFLPWMLLGALLGGFILNLMPCVFPVLSLKALSLANGDASTHHRNGWAYTAGIVISFLLVAVIIIVAKSTGESLGWGFQLQQPVFVGALVYLFVLLGLNLAGFFEMGTSLMGVGNKLTQGDGATASFFTGVLAAVVASPCTAPFMASAVGFAVTQSTVTALLVFAFLGLGLAAPYLLLCYIPAVANRMPNPGPWMVRLKQLLSFPMFITSAWLLGVLGNQTSAKTASFVVFGAIVLTFAIWVVQGNGSNFWRWTNRAIGSAATIAAVWIIFNVDNIDNQEDSLWTPYSAETIASYQSDSRPVFVDLTADWCITCKVNEKVAIDREAVTTYAKENNIAMVKGDWTKNDPKITEYLASFNRNGVPLYVMYSKDARKQPQVLPQILTEELVLDAMKQAIQ